jgi:hypothetical protein
MAAPVRKSEARLARKMAVPAVSSGFPVGLNDLLVTGKFPQGGGVDVYPDSHSLSLSLLARRSTHAFALFQRSHFDDLLT